MERWAVSISVQVSDDKTPSLEFCVGWSPDCWALAIWGEEGVSAPWAQQSLFFPDSAAVIFLSGQVVPWGVRPRSGGCARVRPRLDAVMCAGAVEAGSLFSSCNSTLILVKAVIVVLWGIRFAKVGSDILLKELASYKEKSVFSRLCSKGCFE